MKTYDTALLAIDFALLYSNCQIVTTAKTVQQANLIIEEKIDKIFKNKNPKEMCNFFSTELVDTDAPEYKEIKEYKKRLKEIFSLFFAYLPLFIISIHIM